MIWYSSCQGKRREGVGMRVRQTIHIFLLLFATVLVGCFAYGAYLMHSQRTRLEAPVSPVSPIQTVDQLVQNAAHDLEKKHIEQALIGYRKALTLAPGSVEAQLGIADGE